MGLPSIFPHGVTVYQPDKCFNGYTIVPIRENAALLFDMNGREVRQWEIKAMPPYLLPGGSLLGVGGYTPAELGRHAAEYVVQVDWDGNVVWKSNRGDEVTLRDGTTQWMARYHHDIQREGAPVGYYVPDMPPKVTNAKTLFLSNTDSKRPEISDFNLLDDRVVEVDWEGNIIWTWCAGDHFDEFGFDDDAKAAIRRNPNYHAMEDRGDYLHINCTSYVGPNPWYDAGDERFHPDNIIVGLREANIIAIVDKTTGNLTWKLGPDYNVSEETKKIGWIIGQHHAHIIPQGLPGAGNILVFDNGGSAGYGAASPDAPTGIRVMHRDHSRVLEINPVTLELVWSFTPEHLNCEMPVDGPNFYSQYISSAQRLPNGNTLICEGANGRVMEMTVDHEIVWEWLCPYYSPDHDGVNNRVYRAYRYPYSYIPQEPIPVETPIAPVDKCAFRVPGSAPLGGATVVPIKE